MTDLNVHFSSDKQTWTTPIELFRKLDSVYHFVLDAAASKENALCSFFYTEEDNALLQDWKMPSGGVIFVNPPYGRVLPKFVEKAYQEYTESGVSTIMLIPARPDTKYWHQYIFGTAQVAFLKGRLKFGNSKDSAPFPSALIGFGVDFTRRLDSLPMYVVE